MEPAPGSPPEPRRTSTCLSRCVAALLVGLGLALVAIMGWSPFVRWFAARADARARGYVLALEEELGPPQAAPDPDAGPLLDDLAARLGLTAAEAEALFREENWRKEPALYRDPAQPAPDEAEGLIDDPPEEYAVEEHRAILDRLLQRLDAVTPRLDEALACDGWRVPTHPYDSRAATPFDRLQLRNWLDVRGLARGGAHLWADVVRVARLAALVQQPSEVGLALTCAETGLTVHAIERALQRAPLDAAAARELDALLTALDRPDAPVAAYRAELSALLSDFTPDVAGLERLERMLGAGQPRGTPFPLRLLAYLDDRARWARLYAQAIREVGALQGDPRAAEARLRDLLGEAKAAGELAVVSTTFLPHPRGVLRHAEARAHARLARAALAWALAAGPDPLPPEGPPPLLDPLAGPGVPLRWRLDGPRAFTVWSVGLDGVDGGAVRPAEPGDPETDLALRVTLP